MCINSLIHLLPLLHSRHICTLIYICESIHWKFQFICKAVAQHTHAFRSETLARPYMHVANLPRRSSLVAGKSHVHVHIFTYTNVQVRIFVLIYHEVSFTLPNGSGHALSIFSGIHSNVTVLRAPPRKLKNRVISPSTSYMCTCMHT
jgi:hypothetical protein